MAASKKISVLVPEGEARRFEAFCHERGYKKSTLIVRLIKEFLEREQYPLQESLIPQEGEIVPKSAQEKNQ